MTRHKRKVARLGTLLAAPLLAACASTTIDTSGTPVAEPLCQRGGPALSTAVFWGPQWREDQKEPALREAMALRGIQDFIAATDCLAPRGLHRLQAVAAPARDEEIARTLATLDTPPQRVVVIVVRELGPTVSIGFPAIVEGKTEVVLDVQLRHPGATTLPAERRTVWRNGGALVVKGVKTLEQDMHAALNAALMGEGAR